ncbi:MAG: hypothetical protein QOI61_1663 [Actinomycetota bacterium]
MKPRIARTRRGEGFDLNFPVAERELLASLPLQLVEILDDDPATDPALARLFPDAYTAADTDLADEYRRLMNDDLRDRLRGALEAMSSSAHATHVSGEELYAWMTALGQLRLVLGTRIGVTEDWEPDDDDAAGQLYGYLTWLQGEVVEALASTL